MGLFDNLFKDSSKPKRDNLPAEMLQQFRSDAGKNVVISVETEAELPNPPFKGPAKRASKGNKVLFSKMFNGIMTVTADAVKLDNSAAIHKPKFDLGYETELDYTLTLCLYNGRWQLEYYDKSTAKTTTISFEGFMYFGGR